MATKTVKDGVVTVGGQDYTALALGGMKSGRVEFGLDGEGNPYVVIDGEQVTLEPVPEIDAEMRPLNLGTPLGTNDDKCPSAGEEAAERVEVAPKATSAIPAEPEPAGDGEEAGGGVLVGAFSLEEERPTAPTFEIGRLLAPGDLSEDRGHVLKTRERREVQAILTPDELAEVAKEQAEAYDRWDRAVEEEKARAKEARRANVALKAEVDRLSQIHSTGKEERMLDIEVWAVFDAGLRIFVRADTMEVLQTFPLGNEDRQQQLPLKPRTPAPPTEASTYTWEPGQERAPEGGNVIGIDGTATGARTALVEWVAGQDEGIHRQWNDMGSRGQVAAVRLFASGDAKDPASAFAWVLAEKEAADVEEPGDGTEQADFEDDRADVLGSEDEYDADADDDTDDGEVG